MASRLCLDGDERGQHPAVMLVGVLIVGSITAVIAFPIALEEVSGTELGGSSAGADALWMSFDAILVLALFALFFATAYGCVRRL